MAYKDILVHIDDSKACARRLEVAIRMARTHEAHLTGLYTAVDPLLPGNIRAEVPSHLLETLKAQTAERIEVAKSAYIEAVERAGVSADCHTVHCPGTRIGEVISLHGRYADLVVLGQPEPDDGVAADIEVVEDVVLSVGRPVLVVPYIGAGETLGERIMVAWDGGREAARAVNDALPAMERADSVAVLVVNPSKGGHGEQPGADIALHLARHKIEVEAQHLESRDITVGDALLSRLADESIDLLVMGAYGHSRLRELVLGGVTRQVFEQMTVPVLMSH